MRYLLHTLALVSVAVAQNAGCSTKGTYTIQNKGDASALASCSTFTGNIAIATQTTDIINIPDVKRINGDLVMTEATNVTGLTADSLQTIDGDFRLLNNQLLSQLSFPFLTGCQQLNFEGLPNLNTLDFDTNLRRTAKLRIENTFLANLGGINLQEVGEIYIANNPMLQSLSFQVSNIVGPITIMSNGDRLEANFPNLESAKNMTFRNCPTVSIPSLHNVTGHLGFYESTMQSISAANLTGIGGTLAINDNTQLTNISMPLLKKIVGGLQVENNTVLQEISFPEVEQIGGALSFLGGFKKVELPSLKDNRGAFNIKSSEDITSQCAPFESIHGPNKVIKGQYSCEGNVDDPAGNNAGGKGNKKSGSPLTAGTPSGSLVALVCFLAALIAL